MKKSNQEQNVLSEIVTRGYPLDEAFPTTNDGATEEWEQIARTDIEDVRFRIKYSFDLTDGEMTVDTDVADWNDAVYEITIEYLGHDNAPEHKQALTLAEHYGIEIVYV